MKPDMTTPEQNPAPTPAQPPVQPAGFRPIPPPDMSVPPSPDKAPKTSKLTIRRKSLRTLILSLVILIVAAVLAAVSAMIWYQSQLKPLGEEATYHVITVPSGASTAQIADMLQEDQIIRNSRAFAWYVRLNGNTSLQAGDYRLSGHQSVSEIVTILSEGKVSTIDVLIPPGLRLDQIKAILVKAGFEELEIDDALARVRDHALLSNVAQNALLEGYLFPDTYQIGPQTDAETLLRMMLDNFEEQITKDIRDNLAAQNITLKDAIILASIIQKEVPDYDTQRIVAQVFIKRLKESNPLGADPTFKYVAAMTGQAATPDLDSPYNTRIYSGLPPTAIANFNISALKAVAHPSRTDYNYFVSGDDGKTHFTHTLEQHEAATRRYCTTLCE